VPVPNITCPICNEVIEAGNTSCPRCGFKLVGATQAFNPITVETEDGHRDEDLGTPALEVVSGPYAGESFILGDGSFTLGRDPKCDIFLSNMTVSRHHSTITIKGESAKIEDAGSTNGTWIDGDIAEEADLKPGTRVQIGTFDMIFKRIK
jgi:hypothetical protein